MVEERKFIKPACPNCGRHVVVRRQKTNDFVCRQCPTNFKWDSVEGKAYDIVVQERRNGVKK